MLESNRALKLSTVPPKTQVTRDALRARDGPFETCRAARSAFSPKVLAIAQQMNAPANVPAVDDARALSDALDTLRSLPGISGDPRATAVLEEIARRVDPAYIGKAQHLARAAQLVNSSLEVDAVLGVALERAVDVMKAERGFVVMRDGREVCVGGGDAGGAHDLVLPVRAIVDRVLATGEAAFGADAADERMPLSIACVPLCVRSDVVGVVYLDSNAASGLFKPSDREMLVGFANQVALAVENARLFQEERDRRQRISTMQAFQTRILEAIANGVITLSPERKITTFNRAAEITFGITSEAMVGAPADAIAEVIPEFPELLATFFESGAVSLRAEVHAERAGDAALTLEMRLSPLHSAGGVGAAIVVTDITNQRNLEKAHEAELVKSSRIAESFSRYLAPHVVASLMDDPSSIELGGERTRATMLFADVRGFTSIASALPAERVVDILNTYFEAAVGVVFGYDGLLDKFYGDGVMAVFGPPRVRADDASRAVAAAILLQDQVASLGPRLDYPLRISIGLATGDVVAGHFGSTMRMDYTVVGDAVNLASGLQSAAPANAIYMDEATLASAGPIARPVERLSARIKGRSALVTVYAIA